MLLFEKIQQDRLEARKDKNVLKSDLLGCVIAESSKQDKVPSDEKVISTIRKFIKGAEDTLSFMNKMCLDSPYDEIKKCTLNDEVVILDSYLPKQLDEVSIRTIITPFKGQSIGVVMKYFKDNYSGQYDGKEVSRIAGEILKG